MEEVRVKFVAEVVRFAADWYVKTVKEYIAKYPEIALKMSEERMTRMKGQVNELVKNSEKAVKSELESSVVWWHLKPRLHDAIDEYKQVGDRYPEILDRAVRRALGRLGVVLEQAGFNVSAGGRTGAYQEFWFEQFGGRGTVSTYPHLLKWSDAMQNIARDYNGLYLDAVGLFNEIQLLKEEKKRREALTRWDSL